MPIVSNGTAPPVKTATPPKPATPKAPSKKTQEREEALNGLGQIAQIPLVSMGQLADAGAVGIHFPKVAHELASLAEKEASIAAVIDPLLKVGPYTALVTAVLPLAMQIMVNHGRGTAGIMGTVKPEMLESQMKLSLLHAEAAMREAEAEAEAHLREMEAALKGTE